MNKIYKLFDDLSIVKKIQEKLPTLFQLAEIDNQRDGKLGMEIGSAREKIIIAFWELKKMQQKMKLRKLLEVYHFNITQTEMEGPRLKNSRK
jgi:hypothetical protein